MVLSARPTMSLLLNRFEWTLEFSSHFHRNGNRSLSRNFRLRQCLDLNYRVID
jgi:hypothetical protein